MLQSYSDSDKKVHQGWGGDEGESELKVETAAAVDAAVEGADDTTPATPAEGEKAEEPKRQEEEEDNTLTLDQYLKKQTENKLEIVPKLETRKANEGDDTIWKDAVAITKKDEEEGSYFVGKVRSVSCSSNCVHC